jgi:hypothetical protein
MEIFPPGDKERDCPVIPNQPIEVIRRKGDFINEDQDIGKKENKKKEWEANPFSRHIIL